MRSRFPHPAMVVVGLVVLLGTVAPPAQALTAFQAAFVGVATATAALDYPCAETVSSTTLGGLPCPPPVPQTHCLPLHGAVTGLIPNCHAHFAHNAQGLTVTTTMCAGTAEHVVMPALPPFTGPGCALVGGGHISGWCGLNGGQAMATVTFTGHLLVLDVHFTGVGVELIVTGHYTNPADGHHGKVTGVITAIPPTPVTTPSGHCLAKHARTFTLVGTVTGVPEVLL